MRIAERICIALVLVGIVWRILHWPGAGVMILLGMSGLIILYFILGSMLFRAKESRITIPSIAIPAGLALATALAGILFKIQLWPGSGTNLAFGAFSCLVIVAPWSYFLMNKYRNEPEQYLTYKKQNDVLDEAEIAVTLENGRFEYVRNILKRALVTGTIAAALYFTPWSAFNRIWFYDDPEYGRLITRVMDNPGNEQYQRDLEEYRFKKFNPGNNQPLQDEGN